MEPIEHFGESGAWHQPEDVSLCHNVVGTSDIEGNDLAVKFDYILYGLFIFFEVLSFSVDVKILLVELAVAVHVLVPQEVVIGNQVFPQSVVLHALGLEHVIHFVAVVLESLLYVPHSCSPVLPNLAHVGYSIDVDVYRQGLHEFSVQGVILINDLTTLLFLFFILLFLLWLLSLLYLLFSNWLFSAFKIFSFHL